jgi:superfamily II DNA or RNA helicase
MTAELWSPLATRPTLRPYQGDAVSQVDAAVTAGWRAPILVLPTGSGKTVIAAAIIENEIARGGRVLFLAPRRELIDQTLGKLRDVGIEPHVEMAGAPERAGREAPVWLASVDTILSRAVRRARLVLPAFTLILVDECHLSVTLARQALLDRWPDAVRLGLTATPCRKDMRPLGALYDTIIQPASVAELTAAGYLVPARYWSWPTPDLRGVRVTAGDYNLQDLEARMNRAPLLGDVVRTWLEHAGDRRTIEFCTSIAHAIALAEAFRREGIAAESVDAGTPAPARKAAFGRFRSGETQVLTNCFLAAYGFDVPPTACVGLVRPTRSEGLYLQMIGRGLRPAPGKVDCIVLDHAGCVHEHGFAADERVWTLHGKTALAPTPSRPKEKAKAKSCPRCSAIFDRTTICPECGFELRPQGKLVKTLDGDLVEIGAGAEPEEQDRLTFYLELRAVGLERGYNPKWPACQFKDRFGTWPPWAWNRQPALEPSLATQRWVKSRLIAWARRKVA